MPDIARLIETARRDARCLGAGEIRALCDEVERLRRLEAAGVAWVCASDEFNSSTNKTQFERLANAMRDTGVELERLCREAADKARRQSP